MLCCSHVQVPELEGDFTVHAPNFIPFLEKFDRAQQQVGKERAIPMLIGPVTYVLLAKRDLPLADAVDRCVVLLSVCVIDGLMMIYVHTTQGLDTVFIAHTQQPFLQSLATTSADPLSLLLPLPIPHNTHTPLLQAPACLWPAPVPAEPDGCA